MARWTPAGGASFAYDGVELTLTSNDNGVAVISVVCTLDGSPVSEDVWVQGFLYDPLDTVSFGIVSGVGVEKNWLSETRTRRDVSCGIAPNGTCNVTLNNGDASPQTVTVYMWTPPGKFETLEVEVSVLAPP